MKIAISVLWLVFAVIFLVLGLQHWSEAKRGIPFFPTPEQRELNGISVNVNIAGQDLDKPINDFIVGFNTYLAEQNRTNRLANERSAWGYFIASLTALFAVFLEWRNKTCALFKFVIGKVRNLLMH